MSSNSIVAAAWISAAYLSENKTQKKREERKNRSINQSINQSVPLHFYFWFSPSFFEHGIHKKLKMRSNVTGFQGESVSAYSGWLQRVIHRRSWSKWTGDWTRPRPGAQSSESPTLSSRQSDRLLPCWKIANNKDYFQRYRDDKLWEHSGHMKAKCCFKGHDLRAWADPASERGHCVKLGTFRNNEHTEDSTRGNKWIQE